jgi:hypothetical protein
MVAQCLRAARAAPGAVGAGRWWKRCIARLCVCLGQGRVLFVDTNGHPRKGPLRRGRRVPGRRPPYWGGLLSGEKPKACPLLPAPPLLLVRGEEGLLRWALPRRYRYGQVGARLPVHVDAGIDRAWAGLLISARRDTKAHPRRGAPGLVAAEFAGRVAKGLARIKKASRGDRNGSRGPHNINWAKGQRGRRAEG